jgi:Zn-dependent protease
LSLAAEIAAVALAAILAITLHEAAHGYAARALGDDTAARLGRVSLNPLRHVDMVGTLLVPGMLVVGQLLTLDRVVAAFGWAKPVPVNFLRLYNPRWGMVLVAAAGPAVNFVLAFGFALALHWLRTDSGSGPPSNWMKWLDVFCWWGVFTNVLLACFNLLPIPPLDGGRIMVGVLPAPLAISLARVERFGLLIVIVLIVLPHAIPALDPLNWLLAQVVLPLADLICALAWYGGPA